MSKKPFLMIPPLISKNSYFLGKKVIFIIILFNIFLISLSNSLLGAVTNQIDNVSIFLENLMIREAGIYTLLGSKPMTEFNITMSPAETEEEFAQSYEELKWCFEQKKQGNKDINLSIKVLPNFEDYKKEYIIERDSLYFLNSKKIWNAWLKEKGTFSTLIYKLTFREGDYKTGLFINVPQMLHILKKYQKKFSQITGIQFDVNTILDSIENKNSIFWEKVFRNHYLHGLLLGYGEKNSYLFDWMVKNSLPLESVSMLRFPEFSRFDQQAKIISKKNITINDLSIPYFVSFEINDEEMERYTKEREKIINFLKDKDFIPFVLNCLNR